MRIPDGWPPSPLPERETMLVPLFPLPNVYLFPGTVMRLHVFEPRYRSLVQDQLDRQGRIVMGNIREDHVSELAASPPIHSLAGLGEIAHHRRFPDGRFLIWLVGLCRVRVNEVENETAYRTVEAEIVEEIAPTDERVDKLRPHLEEAILQRTNGEEMIKDDLPLGLVVDKLIRQLQLPQSAMQPLFSELDIAKRAEKTLRAHIRQPIKKEK